MDMGRNSEHYSDPTPGTAWENMRREEKRLDAARLVVVSALVPILRQLANFAYKAWLIEHTEEVEKAKKTEELLTELISYGVMKGAIRNDE